MHRELIVNFALYIACVLGHRKLYLIYLFFQAMVFGAPLSDSALLLMGVNSVMFSALTMLWFIGVTDKLLKK
jgi:hypothetical protein